MFAKMIKKVFGSRNERLLKQYRKTVIQINALEPEIEKLSDEALKAKTEEYKKRYQEGESLDKLLPEAFATVREAGKRVLNMRHFDVQLIGGMVLNDGKISEMRTGEGKTLVATLSAYLNALSGKGVHIVTVNDYLATRDAAWMGQLYGFLGMTTGISVSGMEHEEKVAAYQADITYGTNNEFGFDYLRDNMAFSKDQKVLRELNFAVVDEVDSILIDEARTPLIISGATEDDPQMYQKINGLIPKLSKQEEEDGPGDYSVDEKYKQAYLTEAGHQHVEELMFEMGLLKEGESLYDASKLSLMHHLTAGLRAHVLFHKDVEYIVQHGQVVIVDEFTGRTMPGRRWSEGLHQAVEAKEGVPIQNETQTLASITFQNFFRIYNKLSGMTGTADTEAPEFLQIYNLEVVLIPTHQDMIRNDMGDAVFLTGREKFNAIIDDIASCQKRKQPVLVGTTSIETSEYLSDLLKKQKIHHQVLNAKQHEREAHIVEQAGQPSAVTIATNMAGRGTDIVLGGNITAELERLGESTEKEIAKRRESWAKRHQQVLGSGGLHIIGTERHESRRIDNQLRGRSGRQGDPGSSRFYLSLEDDLMRIFASEKVSNLMQKLGMEEGEAIEHPWVTKAIENAQRKVEGRNFDMRKQLLKYDDVANDQRKFIYARRFDLMELEDISQTIKNIRSEVVKRLVDNYIQPQSMDETWDINGLQDALEHEYGNTMEVKKWLKEDDSLHEETLRKKIVDEVEYLYDAKEKQTRPDIMRNIEKGVMLQVLDQHWKDHLAAMDYLRQGIGLRGYAQKNPEQEYKREAFIMFQQMLDNIDHEVINILTHVQVPTQDELTAMEQQMQVNENMQYEHADVEGIGDDHDGDEQKTFVRQERKVGRNETCPCGSGKKYKNCHGQLN